MKPDKILTANLFNNKNNYAQHPSNDTDIESDQDYSRPPKKQKDQENNILHINQSISNSQTTMNTRSTLQHRVQLFINMITI